MKHTRAPASALFRRRRLLVTACHLCCVLSGCVLCGALPVKRHGGAAGHEQRTQHGGVVEHTQWFYGGIHRKVRITCTIRMSCRYSSNLFREALQVLECETDPAGTLLERDLKAGICFFSPRANRTNASQPNSPCGPKCVSLLSFEACAFSPVPLLGPLRLYHTSAVSPFPNSASDALACPRRRHARCGDIKPVLL